MNELHFIIYILNRAVSAFPDWNPPHFLDTAEISHGIAIGKCVKSIYVGKTYTPIFVSPMNRRHDGNTLLTATPIPATATPTFFSLAGYDWFYAHTPEADKRAIEAGVLKNGFQAYLKAIEDGNEWVRAVL